MLRNDPQFLGLIKAIHEEPENDWLRQVLADWLQDHEEEAWAQFIRDQIAWDHLEPKSCHANIFCEGGDWTKGKARRRCPACRLQAAIEQRIYLWGTDPPWFWRRSQSWTSQWERGFIEGVTTGGIEDALRALREVLPIHPVQRVTVQNCHPQLASSVGPVRRLWWDVASLGGLGGRGRDADDIPSDIFDALEGHLDATDLSTLGTVRVKGYKTESDAYAALSRALVAVVRRELAGKQGRADDA